MKGRKGERVKGRWGEWMNDNVVDDFELYRYL